ncbi:OmcA/MtrC family decaheme c-type cytochrome [Geovibrio thiophilus]|uniref:OmcA/MtrC family decaheme c-type cytochrome n=1 Tax=Geovibrio thiophilus TaxID=139438 RepID=A0A3R5YYH7_9BACT|nr:OmcA/MtrC family decaheme c-type cytochrome [Geovibrio thiophilus]QAR32526.1 OmcA/MtrC family decaheme c-type cytochrome [Geovibrio thiophilus]
MSKRLLLLVMATLLCMFVAVGCGSDGSDGKDVDPGTVNNLQATIDSLQAQLDNMTASDNASQETIEALEAQIADLLQQLNDTTVVEGELTVENIAVASDSEGVEISFSVKDAAGKYINGFRTVYRSYYNYAVGDGTNISTSLVGATLANSGNIYSLTIPADNNTDLATRVTANEALRYLAVLNGTFSGTSTYVNVVKDSGVATRDLISDAACMNCHGDHIFRAGKATAVNLEGELSESTRAYHRSTVGVVACVVCHENSDPGHPRTNLDIYVHKIHASHGMPAGIGDDNTTEGVARVKDSYNYSVSYPYVEAGTSDCTACHDTDAKITAVTAQANFTYDVCMSCHKNWDFWTDTQASGTLDFHRGITEDNKAETANLCVTCHTGGAAPTFAQIHSGYDELRETGKDFRYVIDEIRVTDPVLGTVEIDWYIENPADGTKYDLSPVAVTDPGDVMFTGVSMYLAYGTKDDWTNQGTGVAAGQPSTSSVILAADRTTAGAGIATSTATIPAGVLAIADNVKGAVVIQGRPTLMTEDGTVTPNVPGVVKAFNFDDTEATERRTVVDTEKCLACHGTLAFHGGSRVMSVELCTVCHNPNLTDRQYREIWAADVNGAALFEAGVGSASILDGKEEESSDLRYMLHRIHSVTQNDEPYVLFRNTSGGGSGIYMFYGPTMPANFENTYGIASGWNTGHITYPRDAKDCEACHNAGTYEVPDQTKAVALTIGEGVSPTTHTDDVVVGPAQAACTSCHTGEISDATSMGAHTLSFGYNGAYDKTAPGVAESCATCHSDVAEIHED